MTAALCNVRIAELRKGTSLIMSVCLSAFSRVTTGEPLNQFFTEFGFEIVTRIVDKFHFWLQSSYSHGYLTESLQALLRSLKRSSVKTLLEEVVERK
jgi:hypothetical protein